MSTWPTDRLSPPSSVTGAIVGDCYGLAAFPKAWLDVLVARRLIEDVLQRLLSSRL
jgi:ADP-ribosylglycohydrolase